MSLLGNFFDFMRGFKRATVLGPGFLFTYPTMISGSVGEIAAMQAMTLSSVYAAIHAYEDTISAVELAPCEVTDEFSPIQSHPLRNILGFAWNDEETSQQAVGYLIASALTTGNAYAQIIRDVLGAVVQLIPIDPVRVTPERFKGKLRFKISGYGQSNDSKETVLQARDMIAVHLNFNRKLLTGVSPIGFARTTIGLGLSLDNYGLGFFTQGAVSQVMLEAPPGTSEAQAKQIMERWQQNYAGQENAGRTGLLTGGVKVHTLALTPEDSQFLESRQFTVNEIARWFNLPASRIGGNRASGTYANLAQDQLAFLLHSIQPLCVRFEQELNFKLLEPDEIGKVKIRFNLDKLMKLATTAVRTTVDETPSQEQTEVSGV